MISIIMLAAAKSLQGYLRFPPPEPDLPPEAPRRKPTKRKGPVKLHEDLWGIIISHLRVPLPTPNRQSEVHAVLQRDLTVAMRVCKVSSSRKSLHIISELILRRGIITLVHSSTRLWLPIDPNVSLKTAAVSKRN